METTENTAGTVIDAAHCHALAEIAYNDTEGYALWRESRAIILAIGGPHASLVSIGGAREGAR